MNFNFTDEQTMLSDMVNRLFERDHDQQTRRRRLAGETRAEPGLWSTLGQLGLLGLYVPEEFGGTENSAQESAIASHIVAKAMGRTLAVEPFIANAVVAAGLLMDSGTARQRQEILPELASGRLKVVLAHSEGGRGNDLIRTQTTATATSDGYRLSGNKVGIHDGGSADCFIVSARTAGNPGDEFGISLFLLDRQCPGLQILCTSGFDGSDIGELHLEDVLLSADKLMGTRDTGFRPMQQAVHRGISALLAEAVGAMERLLEMSIEHLKTRKQFGQPLAQFQALQHHLADMATAIEQSVSMSMLAIEAICSNDDIERTRKVAAAKFLIGRNALQIGKTAVQLHGGIGMTDELAVGHYFRRLMVIDATWGNAEEHLGCFINVC